MGILSVKDNPPEHDMECLVWNEKGWMSASKANYNKECDVFINNEPGYWHSVTLEVSHYLPIPKFKGKC